MTDDGADFTGTSSAKCLRYLLPEIWIPSIFDHKRGEMSGRAIDLVDLGGALTTARNVCWARPSQTSARRQERA